MKRKKTPAGLRTACAATLLAGMLAPAQALANGRYPASQQLVVDPGNPARLWLRATYGVLTSPDAGKNWDYLCEAAVGFNTTEDPMFGVTKNGTLFAASNEGLLTTRDEGCSFGGDPDVGQRITRDLAVEGDQSHVLVLTTESRPNGNYLLRVHRSDEASANFAPIGGPISQDVLGLTLDPAPSDPKRIYVSGVVYAQSAAAIEAGVLSPDASAGDAPGVLLRSKDGGMTWERLYIPGATVSYQPFIAAVHPTNPDVLYVRVMGPPQTFDSVESFLLYSEDGGDHFREVFRKKADMLGFALSKDGQTVFVGMGDTHDPSRPADASVLGIYAASAPDLTFSRRLVGQVSCLTESDAGLYVCGGHDTVGWEVGLSTDGGQTATPLFDFKKSRGPLACAAGTPSSAACENTWPSVCGQLGVSCTLGPPPLDFDASFPPPKTTPARKKDGGCGCETPARDSSPPAGGAGGALLALLVLGARRRRRSTYS